MSGTHTYGDVGSDVTSVTVTDTSLALNTAPASGSAVVTCLVWVLCLGVSWSFPVVAAKSGAYAFGFFALMMVLQFVLVLKFLPETKGISLEELQKRLGAAD